MSAEFYKIKAAALRAEAESYRLMAKACAYDTALPGEARTAAARRYEELVANYEGYAASYDEMAAKAVVP